MRVGILLVLSSLCWSALSDTNATASDKATEVGRPLTTDGTNGNC